MSKRSEEAALELYPVNMVLVPLADGGTQEEDGNFWIRKYIELGYEQAEKDLGWHSVDECLPEMDEEVIVLKDILVEGGLKVGFGKIAFGHIVDRRKCSDYNGWNSPGVRYWMPCPKIPEE